MCRPRLFALLLATPCACALASSPATAPATARGRSQAPAQAPPSRAGDPYAGLLAAGRASLAVGHADDAAARAREASALAPERAAAYALWGRALAQDDRIEPALRAYDAARARHMDAVAYAELAALYDLLGRDTAAEAVYREYLAGDPDAAPMRHELGLTLLRLGRPHEAVAQLQRAARGRDVPADLPADLAAAAAAATASHGAR